MTITVKAPNGVIVNFPDGTAPAAIDKAMREALGTPQAAPASQEPATPQSQAGAWFSGIGNRMGEIGGPLLQDFNRGTAAAEQGTSPIVRGLSGNLNYQPLGPAQIGDDGTYYLAGPDGKMVPTDSKTQVVLTDPQTGKPMVYARDPRMNEGKITGVARMVLPGIASTAPEMGAARAVAGAATGPQAGTRLSAKQIVGAFDRSGITPTAPTVVRNKGIGGIAQMLNNTVAGTPISKSFAMQADQAAARAEELAGQRGSNVGLPSVAGERLQQGGKEFAANAATRQDTLYDNARSLIDPAAPSPLTATRLALSGARSQISNPEIRALFTDKNFADVAAAIDKAGETGVNFNDLRALRTMIREVKPAEGSKIGIDRRALTRVYQGLTHDMYTLARQSGGEGAVQAVHNADRYTRALEAVRLPAIQKILNSEGQSGENTFAQVMKLAQEGSGADWRKLLQIKRSVGVPAWDDLTATVIRRMGLPTKGSMASVDLDQFSPGTFMTNFNKLSPHGKATLFGSRQGELGKALDDLSTATGEMKRVAQLGNPSGTGRQQTAMWTALGVFFDPVKTIGLVGGGHVLARIMVSPKLVRWLANPSRSMTALPSIAGQDQEVIDLLERVFSNAAVDANVRGTHVR